MAVTAGCRYGLVPCQVIFMNSPFHPLFLLISLHLACQTLAQEPVDASGGDAVRVDPRITAAVRSAPTTDLLERLLVEVQESEGVAKMRAEAKHWFLGAVWHCHGVETECKTKIASLEEARRKHERAGDREGVDQVAEEILGVRKQIELAYQSIGSQPGILFSRLFVDLKGPFGQQIAEQLAGSSLPELKRDLLAASRRSKSPADRDELRRLIGRIDDVLSKIEKGDLSGADEVLRQEWQRVMEPEGSALASSASEASTQDTAKVAWPVGVRDEQARQRWEKFFESKADDPSQPIEAWRSRTKRSYVFYFVGIGEGIADSTRHLERLKKELGECEEMGDKAGVKELAQKIQSVESGLKASAVTRLDVALPIGHFFLPAVSGLGREGAEARAKSLEMLCTYFRDEARNASPAEVERAKWLIQRANLVAEHLRNRKHRDAERVCDEVVRWILDAGEPLQHEPGSPSFGNLAGK